MADGSFNSIRSVFSLESIEPDFSIMCLSERSLKEKPQPSPPEPEFETLNRLSLTGDKHGQFSFHGSPTES